MFKHLKYLFSVILLLAIMQACATYYDKSKKTEIALLATDYDKAKHSIEHNKFLKKKRNILLYHLELGKITHMSGDFDTSNYHLNIADHLMEESNVIGDFAISTLANPALQKYRASAYEKIIIHYYKALNYLQLGDIENAVVEARQLNLKEQELFVIAKGKDKKYAQDPFGLILMGMIYEADNDFNNAFITYRNAFEVYNSSKVFKDKMPHTLRGDIARTSKLAGIYYKIDNNTKIANTKGKGGELILFWENGLAPIKKEETIIFSMNKGTKKGLYIFSNSSNSIVIPVNYDFEANDEDFDPSDIGVLRLAYSYYESRKQFNHHAQLNADGKNYGFSLGEDIEQIAFQIEKERRLKELGKMLIRMVVKKIAELKVAEQNEYVGLALGITNLAMEKSDTRNWQSLPNQIHYARIPLKIGENTIKMTLENGKIISLKVNGTGKMIFKNIVTN